MTSLKDFYLFYPHKCISNPNTVPNPYFPKTELDCNNKHTLTYAQWMEIMVVYLEELMNYLLKGLRFTMPSMLGDLEVIKSKTNGIRYMFTKSGDECSRRVEKDMLGYRPLLKWYKDHKVAKLPDPWIWKLTILKRSKFAFMLNKKFKKSPVVFNDAKNTYR